MIRRNQTGFTLVELMMASMVFSVIMLGATSATVQLGRMYYKGIIMSRTQETSRRLMDDITRPIQFSGSNVRHTPPTSIGGFETGAICVGSNRYTYALNAQVTDTAPVRAEHQAFHGVWQDTLNTETSSCTALDLTQQAPQDANTNTSVPSREVLGQNMRLVRFNVSSDSNMWRIDMLVIYGDDDLLLPDGNAPTGCGSLAQSAQWCATSALTTQVYKRINPEFN